MTERAPIGSLFPGFLEDEGLTDVAEASAIRMVLARQVRHKTDEQGISSATMARRMPTSRAQVRRLLGPEHDHVRLDTLPRAARPLGQRIVTELGPAAGRAAVGETAGKPSGTSLAARWCRGVAGGLADGSPAPATPPSTPSAG